MLRRETLVPVSTAGGRVMALGVLFSAALALTGCGQKGPLYLPRDPAPSTTPAAAPETVTPESVTPASDTPAAASPEQAAPAAPTSAPDKADQRSEGKPHAA